MRRLPDASPRGKAITVDLEGETIPAIEGEPVACSLIAAGESMLARSIKYHRPRGAYCFASACSHCLMRVDGQPNIYTCRTPAREGMKLERQNAFPSTKVDVFATIDWFFPGGLDHHEMFAGVPVAEQVMAKVARQLAGLGLLPDREAPPRPPARTVRTRVAVVGGGAAGLAAARVLASQAIPFLLVEREARLGGRLLRGAPLADDPPASEASSFPKGSVLTRAHAVGLFNDEEGYFLVVASLEPEGPQLSKVYAERFLLTPGGHPSCLPFENNELPGVYAGRAASQLLREHGVAPERAALVGWGAELYALARLLESNGTQVAALVDLRGPVPAGAPAVACVGAEPKAHGLRKVGAFSFARGGGRREKVNCDAVLVSIPTSPSFELARQGGAHVRFDTERDLFVVEADADGRTAAPQVFVAGDITGGGSAQEAAASGVRAAESLVKSLGGGPS
ncbi:2Fe-2S iron-sulfur cluster-binding protein [Stigmatella sp. ncwal1]|uniref:2Fe-2S iron-sulfur cluster-binding protein n=1 Tax=Stigmatella ashevillensis TaxID=2995309 RepID=A0ABT5D230_9BACT|nr:2Fe-2S iron-sulfur cluster-binding protein [Stigmatella ashevillena]MDC0707719.1 2Fe-2S iron-sulfur cluster-binding protein [Stigmatella ashevillena]